MGMAPHYVRIALHCRFKIPHHYRILNRHNRTGSDEGKPSLPVLVTTGSDSYDNTAG